MLCCSSSHVGPSHANVKPSVRAYVDVAQVWLRPPLSRKDWAWVNGQVGHPLLGYPFNIRCGGRQRLILTQPSEACLRFFAARDGTELNRVELALDIITPFASQLKQWASVGFLQRHHGRREITIFPGDNFRMADLGCRGRNFQAYDDKPSKVYGETDCFHLEAKITGVAALRRLGINSVSDLLTFNHARFWQRHFIIAKIDMARLGRYHANCCDGTKRRSTLIHRKGRFAYNVDAAAGSVLWRIYAALPDQPHYSLQQFIKEYGRHSYVKAATMHHSGRKGRKRTKLPYRQITAALLFSLYILPAPDMRLLEPELCYPLRPHRRSRTPAQSDYRLHGEAPCG